MNPMHRRTFLALGSAPLLSAFLPSLAFAKGQDGSAPGIYYLRGSHEWSEDSRERKQLLEEARAQRDDLVAAQKLPSPRLELRDIEVTFKALQSEETAGDLESVDLEHLSPVYRDVFFSAFSYRAKTLDTLSAPHTFKAPLDARGGMDLRLKFSAKGQDHEETLRFGQGGTPLLPGVYLLSVGSRQGVLPIAMVVDPVSPEKTLV